MSEQIFSLANLHQLTNSNPDSSLEFLSEKKEIDKSWSLVFDKLEGKAINTSDFPELLNKMLQESGVTFNLYQDSYSVSRPWSLDPIPLIYSEQDWQKLTSGLEQRATAWDLFLKDIYGEMVIVREGVIPDETIFNNKSYLRSCQGLGNLDSFGIFNYSADVIRTSRGEFKVVGDKAQNPFGIGYTLENRLSLSRVYEKTFNECKVKRLASFFKTLSENLHFHGSKLDPNPNIVILTPGPYNEGYYEHNLLSRYLGFTLVRGSDLTVRNGYVYLKTIEGLRRVHVILRRQLDAYCDPLELRADSLLGIPGLVQANRLGNVQVMNSIGSGIVNDSLFLHFYEKICNYYLGEKPQISSVGTLWLKDKDSLNEFISAPDKYIIFKVMQGISEKVEVGSLSDEETDKLIQKVKANPETYLALISEDTQKVPSCVGGKVQLSSYKLRTFLCRDKESFKTLDGALCLASSSTDPIQISIQSAQISKDTWVLSKNDVPFVSLLKSNKSDLPIKRSSSDMPSSVIDNLLWLSRYMERAEGQLRIMNFIYNSLMNETGYEIDILDQLYRCIDRSYTNKNILDEVNLEEALLPFLTDHSVTDSVCFLLDRALENASVSRSRISLDTWKLLSSLRNMVGSLPDKMRLSEASKFISSMMNMMSAFHGLCSENMTRESGWRFLDAGKRIERIDHLSCMIKTFIGQYKDDEYETNALKVLLDVADSSMTYNSRYLTSLQIIPAIDLIIADDTNPRSIFYQLLQLEKHFNSLPGNRQYPKNAEQQVISKAINEFNQIDFNELLKVNEQNKRQSLHDYLNSLSQNLLDLSNSINRSYLSHIYNKSKITYSES